MKIKILIAIILILLLLGIFYWGRIFGWMSFKRNLDTPLQFKSEVKKRAEEYNLDEKLLQMEFSQLLKERNGFFHNSSFSDSTTQIIIDTIVYSPDFKKMGVLIIAKNPTSRQLSPDKDYKWYYNSTCYLAIRSDRDIKLKMAGPTFTNEKELISASKDIREACFRNFIVKGSNIYVFNINDKRFWQSRIWQHYFY